MARLSKDLIEQIFDRYSQLKNATKTAKEFGLKKERVIYHIRKKYGPLSPRKPQALVDKILKLRTEGRDVKQIAAITGVSIATAWKYSREIELARKRNEGPEMPFFCPDHYYQFETCTI